MDDDSTFNTTLIDELSGREEGFTDGEVLIPGRPVKPCLTSVFPQA